MLKFEFHNEEQLIEALKAEEREAYNYIYDNYSAALFGVIIRVIGTNDVLAEDILQETFLKIWNNIDSYDAKKGRFYTWIINIARNLAIDTIRSAAFQHSKNKVNINYANNLNNPSDNIPVESLGIKGVTNRLEEKYRVLIDLCYFKGFTQIEVAKKLSIPIGTVKTRLRRALINLKEIIK